MEKGRRGAGQEGEGRKQGWWGGSGGWVGQRGKKEEGVGEVSVCVGGGGTWEPGESGDREGGEKAGES